MSGPSPHLSWAELACKDGTPYPEEWRASRAVVLAEAFEAVRAMIGQPIVVGSAYRTPEHNRRVGGAARSQHCQGRALDLYPPKGMTADQLYATVRLLALKRTSPIYGLGRYPSFVHIDIRPSASGRVTVWTGARAWAELKVDA